MAQRISQVSPFFIFYSPFLKIKYLKKLAAQGKTIICTIHQPSSSVCHVRSSPTKGQRKMAFLGPIKEALFSPREFNVHITAIKLILLLPYKVGSVSQSIPFLCIRNLKCITLIYAQSKQTLNNL